jgi:hypothetical protein
MPPFINPNRTTGPGLLARTLLRSSNYREANMFQLAQRGCCNYSANGPNGKKHYCWLEGIICKLHPDKDMGCFHFVNAVLPNHPKAEAQWRAANPLPWELRKPEEPALRLTPSVPLGWKACPCGKEFRGPNAQKFCLECGRIPPKERKRKMVETVKNDARIAA